MKRFRYTIRQASTPFMAALIIALNGCTGTDNGSNRSGRPVSTETFTGSRHVSFKPDTIRFSGPSADCNRSFNGRMRLDDVLGPYLTNVQADSICWEMVYSSPGISMTPLFGKGSHTRVAFLRTGRQTEGEIIVRACPYRSGHVSKPTAWAIRFHDTFRLACQERNVSDDEIPAVSHAVGTSPISAHPALAGCPPDTSVINRERRQKITEFRDLLYMYTRTSSSREREYFRSDAERKLDEIPGRTVDLLPDSDLHDVFTLAEWSSPRVTPVYDTRRCYITGIRIRQD